MPILTTLRFVAASAVVLAHFESTNDLFPAWAGSLGGSAVTFFFVLSGFIMTYLYCDELNGEVKGGSREFYIKRVARIIPVYWLSLLIALPVYFYSLWFGHTSSGQFIGGVLLVPVLQQTWFPRTALAWNGPAWSLSVEFVFYVLFPYFLALLRGVSYLRLLMIAAFCVLVSECLKIVLFGLMLNNEQAVYWDGGNVNPMFHLSKFLVGFALAKYALFVGAADQKRWRHYLIVSIVVVGVFARYKDDYAFMRSDLVHCIVFGMLIISASLVRGGRIFSVLSCRPLIALGEISFAIYILHLPIYYYCRLALKYVGFDVSDLTRFVIYIAVVLVVSAASFRVVEVPTKKLILSRFIYSGSAMN